MPFVFKLEASLHSIATVEADIVMSSSLRMTVLIDADNVGWALWEKTEALVRRTFPGRLYDFLAFCGSDICGLRDAKGIAMVSLGEDFHAKNSADFLLSFHAGLIIGRGMVDEIVIVSSHNGFASTAQSIRDAGISLYAIVPTCPEQPFWGASMGADITIMLDSTIKRPQRQVVTIPSGVRVTPEATKDSTVVLDQIARAAQITKILGECKSEEDGWVPLSILGQGIRAEEFPLPPGSKLRSYLVSLNSFEFKMDNGVCSMRTLASSANL